ncbi:hypothetical protein A0256_22080 [Mucilaginibacter sp. PAMC 26640]|nr:hypothetical protein A0256_22080 [Mucilaginibacter sp. PAMC 26640]
MPIGIKIIIMSNTKIDVDININAESLKQMPQYKAAFDSLKTSIDNINKEMLKQNAQSKEVVTWGTKIKNSVKDLSDTYELFSKVIGVAKNAVFGWQNILAAVFTLVTTYGPQVLDYLGEIFQSDKTKQAALDLKNYHDVMSAYVENISGEISQVQMLTNVANNETLSKESRIEAIGKLNALAPAYLKNLTLENLKTKEGTALMDDYIKSLNRRAMEEAIQVKRTELVKQRLKLKPDYDSAKQESDDYRTGKRKDQTQYVRNSNSFGIISLYTYSEKDAAHSKFITMVKKDKIITDQITKLDSTLAESLLKYAPKPASNPAQNRAYWEAIISDQQMQLNKLDSHSKLFEKDAKPIIKRIKEAKKEIAKYGVADITVHARTTYNNGDNADKDQQALLESQSRLALLMLDGYAKEVAQTNQHFEKLKETHRKNKSTVEQLERERIATLEQIAEKFENEDLEKLTASQKKINDIKVNSIKDLTEQSLARLKQETEDEKNEFGIRKEQTRVSIKNQQAEIEALKQNGKIVEADILKKAVEREKSLLENAEIIHLDFLAQQVRKEQDILQTRADNAETIAEDKLTDNIQNNEGKGNDIKALQQQQLLLDMQFNFAVAAAKKKGETTTKIEEDYAKKKADLEIKLTSSKIHAGDKFINAVLANSKKDSAIYKAAFLAKKATTIADTIISTKQAVMDSLKAYSGIPFIGTALGIAQAAFMAAQGASTIATIAKQKPGFSTGGQYLSDGRGAVLPGFSRTDNTNAYLRSGEAVVVSEAMRNPWARNLVSAINVAHGGRDFSIPNAGRGYAIGGIYTDGGNANRYYNQPVNDIKDMANTVAYQMINNFPPIYVDVKDVNNQQNILAQTVNRVNL